MRAVDAIMRALRDEGVEVVFGLPGGANLPLYDALLDVGIRHVLVRHEAGGGHAAEGYAKATGKVGVAFATSGPGATNLMTPICDAMIDSVPVVFITGQVRTELLGTDGFQEADTISMSMPHVKHSFLIQEPGEVPQTIHEAFHIARTGRPGPVLIDVPQDISRTEIDYKYPNRLNLPGYRPTTRGHPGQVLRAAQALAVSRRPVLYVGGGVVNANASGELRELAALDDFPVTSTLMALGAFPAASPQSLGMLGMHGSRAANYAIDEADLICAIGARFDDRVTGKLSEFAPYAKIIHIDIDPAEISKNVSAHIPVVGDAKEVLTQLVDAYRVQERDRLRLEEWWQRIRCWQKDYPLHYEDTDSEKIKPQRLIEALYDVTEGSAIIVTDVGQHQMWATQYYHFQEPRRWITSGGLGTMGFGLPAAMGAALGCPGEKVVLLAGDGSLQMNAQELATIASENVTLTVIVFVDRSLGMVEEWQRLFYNKRYSGIDLDRFPDFVKLAEAYGVPGLRLDRKSDLLDGLRRAVLRPAGTGPLLIDVPIVRGEDVYPIIPPGAAARDMID